MTTPDWQGGPIVDNRPWPRTALSIMRDMMNPDNFALGIEILDEKPFLRDPRTGLYVAAGNVPLTELATFFARSPIAGLLEMRRK